MGESVTLNIYMRLIGESFLDIKRIKMTSRVSDMNSTSKSRARVITIVVHIILILLAVLPLLALKPAHSLPEEKPQNGINQIVLTTPVAMVLPLYK